MGENKDKLTLESSLDDCPRVGKCKAPLCPLGEGSKEITWLSDEPICTMFNLDWIKMQGRLQRTRKGGFFNIEMLVAMKRPSHGVDPDSRETAEGWIRRRR